ncbi:hypothetical protein [Paenibacillus sp. IHBB 10380]|uniref:hypothetical protein n=1 Tax=Paenibacillus sp. IHBB 10380 TaxID=1566358 RepID=UPI0005CFBBB2|nr:hypothetical protein [Paenibacillus sp. IHBB 10380]AJS59914.1 hypothetical protein UB51_17170 [Paenibacillus sp. IHBB 10380]
MSNEIKISQHTAILLEHARKALIDEALIREAVRLKDATLLKNAEEEHYQYEDFFTYAEEHGEELEQALEGYRMTFNTRNGLKIWVEEKFNLQSHVDFKFGDNRMDEIHLDEHQVAQLKQSLAVNWVVLEKPLHEGIQEVSLVLRGQENQ